MDFQYLLDRRDRNEEMTKKKEVSLSLATRKKEREAADAWRLELENNLRASKGEQLLDDIGALKEAEAGSAHRGGIDTKDPLVLEAGETMADFLRFLGK